MPNCTSAILGAVKKFAPVIAIAIVFASLACWPIAAWAEPVTFSLRTSMREFVLTGFQIAGPERRPAVLVLGGAKGYVAKAYLDLADELNASGIDMFLVRYLADFDLRDIGAAGSAQKRIAYYAGRMNEWAETIAVTARALREQDKYQSRVGVIGISLGAMPALVFGANNTSLDALAIVDGGFPANYPTPLDFLPPLALVWGGATIRSSRLKAQ